MRFLLLGEQATGKSSLLVAFYGALVHHRAGDMRLVRTVDDVGFLSRGLEALGRRESVTRTEAGTQAGLVIEVAHHGRLVSIELPDRSGEMLRHMLDTRIWDPELQHQVTDAAGAILFLRADEPGVADRPAGRGNGSAAAPTRLAAGDDVSAANGEPGPASRERWLGDARAPVPALDWHQPAEADRTPQAVDAPRAVETGDESEPPAWSPALMPTDVRTVDLAQALLEERSTRLPLVVIVSAWDRAAARASLPPTWLAERVPLLDQFLTSHAEQLPHAVFGVSAQGGDFTAGAPGPADAEDPWDRAFLIGPDGMRATFAEPISWLISSAA